MIVFLILRWLWFLWIKTNGTQSIHIKYSLLLSHRLQIKFNK